jgi:hypothetical protein
MSGVKRAWIASSDFIMVHRSLVAALDGDYEAAMVLDRIRYRSGRDGWWVATQQEMVEETCLSEWKLKQAIKRLRAAGFIESARVSPYDATLKWRVVVDEEESRQPEQEESSVSINQSEESSLSEEEESSVSSTKNERTTPVGVTTEVTRVTRPSPESHPRRVLPDDWQPSREVVDYRVSGCIDVRASYDTFVSFQRRERRQSANWQESFIEWVMRDLKRWRDEHADEGPLDEFGLHRARDPEQHARNVEMVRERQEYLARLAQQQ